MDRVNILYVALTRPEQKLLVVCEDKTSKERMDNIALLQDYCRRHGMQKDIFTIGEDFQSTEQKHSNTQTLKHSSIQTITNASFPAWEDRIGIAEQNESLLSTVVDYVQQPSANGQQPTANPRRYGIMLHEMLSHIISFDDVDSVVDEFCRRTGNVSPTDEAGIKSRIKSMIERDGNSRFFDSRHRVVCEASIVVDGSVCRPDRIVFAEDETWVVDFKTGIRNDETHKQYEQQVARYAEVLTDMGYPDVKPVILYL